MKMTMHVDEALLDRVMSATGVSCKTKAIDLALREMDRRAELKRLAAEGLGLSAAELKEAFDPASEATLAPIVSETSTRYGRKPRARR